MIGAASDLTHMGIPVSLTGRLVRCPRCSDICPILATGKHTHRGISVAYIGGKTACGDMLIRSLIFPMLNPSQVHTLAASGTALPGWGGHPILTGSRLSGTEKLGKLFSYKPDLTAVNNPTLGVWQAKELISADTLNGQEITASIEFEAKWTFIPGLSSDAGSVNVGAGTRKITGFITSLL